MRNRGVRRREFGDTEADARLTHRCTPLAVGLLRFLFSFVPHDGFLHLLIGCDSAPQTHVIAYIFQALGLLKLVNERNLRLVLLLA